MRVLQKLDPLIKINTKRAKHKVIVGSRGSYTFKKIQVRTFIVTITFYVINKLILFFFCLQNINNNGLYFNNFLNAIVRNNKHVFIVRK